MRDLVYHPHSGLLLDFAEDNFGGDEQQAIIEAWRLRRRAHPSGLGTDHGEFVCERHRDRERPWLYLQERSGLLVAAHWPGTDLAGTHQIHHGVSDEHKRQVEYVSRAGEAAGFPVEPEVRLPTGVRSDAVIYGAVNMGVEAQRSALTAAAAKARTTKARRAGVEPIWFSDHRSDPAWFGAVPGVRMMEFAWDVVPRPGSITVVSGVRIIERRRCRDIPDSPCPRRRRGCNLWHPVHEPRLGTTVDDLATLVPQGDLVPMLYKTLSGRKSYVLIVSKNHKVRYEAMTGGSADVPLRQPRRNANLRGDRIDCAADAGVAVNACCGEKRGGEQLPEAAGGPLIPACQLCPNSPTYWRRQSDQGDQ